MNLEVKIFCKPHDFNDVCLKLQRFNKKSQHIEFGSNEGIYPVAVEGKDIDQKQCPTFKKTQKNCF